MSESHHSAGDLQSRVSYMPDIHRMLPASPDAEQGVLSSFLLAPREVGGMCAEKGVKAECFHIPAHATIYAALVEMWENNSAIDFITLTDVLRSQERLDQVGGAAFVTGLFTYLPTAANAYYYIQIVIEKYTMREIIRIGTDITARAYDETENPTQLLEELEIAALGVRKGDDSEIREVPIREGVMEAIAGIQDMYERRGSISGVSTGLKALDTMLDGLQPAEMIVIAARPSMGKTALAMNIAEYIAVDLGKHVAVFSAEMAARQLLQRLLCSRAKVNMSRVRDGFLSERDFPALTAAACKLAESKFHIMDAVGCSIGALRAKARRLHRQHGLVAIFVDYLQLLRSKSRQASNSREREISEISQGLKNLAKELGMPVVVLAQLNRNPESRTGSTKGRPMLSDLRESGSIEQDADTVGLLVREEYYATTDEDREKLKGQATLIIAKQRNGPVGDVPLTFLKEFTRFEERAQQPSEN